MTLLSISCGPTLALARRPITPCQQRRLGGRGCLSGAAAPQHRHRQVLIWFKEGEKADSGAGNDTPADWNSLAKQAAGLLAAELASDQGTLYDRLQTWLHGHEEAHPEHPDIASADDSSSATDAVGLAKMVGSGVKQWLLNPSGGEAHWDAQAVGAIVERLLEVYRNEEKEEFRGAEHQYDALFRLARKVVGTGWSSGLIKSLVQAYLRSSH